MNTDRFTDIIRRKLESIRPDFTEKDWVRMQATLQQATPPSPDAHLPGPSVVQHGWAGQPWLMAAAAVSTVVLISVGVWQRQQINDLRQTVRQLNQQRVTASPPATNAAGPNSPVANSPATPLPGQSDNNPSVAARSGTAPEASVRSNAARPNVTVIQPVARQTDTVYVTRYLPTPVPTSQSTTRRSVQRTPAPADRQNEGAQPNTPGNDPQRLTAPAISPTEQVADTPAKAQKPAGQLPNAGRETEPIAAGDKPTERFTTDQVAGKTTRQPGRNQYDSYQQTGQSNGDPIAILPTRPGNSENPATQTGATGEANRPAVQYELMASRPTQFGTTDWTAALLRRANRTKPTRTTTVGGQSAPEIQPVRHLAVRLRLGAGTDVSKAVWSFSAFTEVIIGRHWTLNLGLSRANHLNGTFVTDADFYRKTRQDFRKGYARGVPPGHDILAIGLRTTRIQLPINVGYRIPLNQNLTLLPSVGTNLNLLSAEHVTFYKRVPFRGSDYEVINNDILRPVNTFNNLTFGTSLEWHQRHWALQGGSVLTAPLRTDTKWQTGLTAGLRARVMYQF